MKPLIHASTAGAGRRCQISVSGLQAGMYVADLDRPWLDTPFLLEGFLVDSKVELETLQRYCRYVYVDPDRSDPGVAQAIRRAEIAGNPMAPATERTPSDSLRIDTLLESNPQREPQAPRLLRARSDVKVSSQTRERFRRFVRATAVASDAVHDRGGVLNLAAGWLRRWLSADDGDDPRAWQQRSLQAVHALIPAGTPLTRHPEPIAFEAALPGARRAIDGTLLAVEALFEAIRGSAALELEPVGTAVDSLAAAMIDNPDAPIWVARLRGETQRAVRHALAVSLYLMALGRSIGLQRETLARLGLTGLLADAGKARLPRALLEKPGMLSPAEHTIVKEHVRLGLEALARGRQLPPEVEQGIAQHHERLDGSGYPKGLRGDEIGLWGRMTAIADSFAALLSARPYAEASAPQDAMMSLYEWADSSFDEALVEQFVQAVGIFPVGSLVELSSGEIAMVMAHNRIRRLEPRVLVLSDARRNPLERPLERELPTLERGSPAPTLRISRGLPAGAFAAISADGHACDACGTAA